MWICIYNNRYILLLYLQRDIVSFQTAQSVIRNLSYFDWKFHHHETIIRNPHWLFVRLLTFKVKTRYILSKATCICDLFNTIKKNTDSLFTWKLFCHFYYIQMCTNSFKCLTLKFDAGIRQMTPYSYVQKIYFITTWEYWPL